VRDPATRARIQAEMLHPTDGTEGFYNEAGGGSGILITGVFQDSLRYIQGKRISEIAAARHRDPIETIFDIVVAEGGHRTDAVYFLMSDPPKSDSRHPPCFHGGLHVRLAHQEVNRCRCRWPPSATTMSKIVSMGSPGLDAPQASR